MDDDFKMYDSAQLFTLSTNIILFGLYLYTDAYKMHENALGANMTKYTDQRFCYTINTDVTIHFFQVFKSLD